MVHQVIKPASTGERLAALWALMKKSQTPVPWSHAVRIALCILLGCSTTLPVPIFLFSPQALQDPSATPAYREKPRLKQQMAPRQYLIPIQGRSVGAPCKPAINDMAAP